MMLERQGTLIDQNEESAIILSPDGNQYRLSSVTAYIWGLCDGQQTKDSLSQLLMDKGLDDQEKAQKMVGQTLQSLHSASLLTSIIGK